MKPDTLTIEKLPNGTYWIALEDKHSAFGFPISKEQYNQLEKYFKEKK